MMRAEILLRSLRDLFDESVLLAKVSDMQGTYLLSFEPSHPLRMSITVGSKLRSLYATSAGKALLASIDERALDDFLRTAELTPLTENTVKSKAALRAQLEEGRRLGWFVNREESVEGVTTLSAPLKWHNTIYIVTIAGPTSRVEPRLALAADLLVDVCKRLEM
jgi:DNA-binding IclR family transcriptional regulator